jgi:hypothetical protein
MSKPIQSGGENANTIAPHIAVAVPREDVPLP